MRRKCANASARIVNSDCPGGASDARHGLVTKFPTGRYPIITATWWVFPSLLNRISALEQTLPSSDTDRTPVRP